MIMMAAWAEVWIARLCAGVTPLAAGRKRNLAMHCNVLEQVLTFLSKIKPSSGR